MAGTDTPWARLDQTFAFQGSDDDEEAQNGRGGGIGYDEYYDGYDGGGRGSRKGSVATIMIGHEAQQQPQSSQYQQHQQSSQQLPQQNNNTHHRTATTLTTSTTSTASTITPTNASKAGHQRQISQLSTQQQQQQQQQQQHRPRPSLDEQYATKPLPPVPQKARIQKSASSRSSNRPSEKQHHRSQPSTSSLASSVSSFNAPGGAADGGVYTSSSLTRGGSVSSPTTLLRPAQSSAGWFSSAAQQRTQHRDSALTAASGRIVIEPPALAPLDLPPLASPPAHTLLATAGNPNARPITPLAQPPLMAPLALPPLKPRSRGGGGGDSSSHLPVAPRTAPHGDTVSLFSVRSMGSVGTNTAASAHNNATRDDSSSMYSERRVPTATAKHSPSLPSLSSFSSSSRLKPAAAVPGKAVRKFMRMAGKAASSAKDAMKGPLHSHNNGSTPSIGSHSAGGTPSITVTTPVPSPMMSPMPSPVPPQSPIGVDTVNPARPSMVPRRRSMSKISQLTGLDMGSATSGSTTVKPTSLGALRRSQSDTPMRGHVPKSSSASALNVPVSTVLSPTSISAPTPGVWNTSMFNSDDENDDDDEVEDEYEADDQMSKRDSISSIKSPTLSIAGDDASIAADTPDPATASLLRSLSQTSSQPPPSVYQQMPRPQPSQQTSPAMGVDHQRTLLPPNRLLKIKRFSDPTMAPIIEHPDDTTNPSGSNSSRASSHYSGHEVNTVSDTADEEAAAFIPSRPAPVPVRSPSPPSTASPTPQSMLSLTLFPAVPAMSATALAKHIPTIRLFPSSADSQASAASPTSPKAATGSPTTQSSSVSPAARKISLPTSSDISNPWPTSPPPRPPPPPPLQLQNVTASENEVIESTTADMAEKRVSGAGSTAMFRTVQWGQMADHSRSSSSTPTGNRLSLHARTKSNGSASESIATSIATSVANSSTSGSSALSSTVASTIGSSNRSAGFGSFSSASTASNRHSYLASPPLPPPPPNYPLPPLPTTVLPMTMPVSMPVSPPSQSAFDHDDDEGGARMMAARMMKKAASRDSVRWRPTALGKSLFRRESSPGPSGAPSTSSSGAHTPATSQPAPAGGLRSSLSTRSSLSATTLLAAQRVAQSTRKAVEAVSEGSSGSSSAARQHELEMEKWREDLRSRIRMIPEGGEATSEAPSPDTITSPILSPVMSPIMSPMMAQVPMPVAQQPKAETQASVHEIRSPQIHDNNLGGMI